MHIALQFVVVFIKIHFPINSIFLLCMVLFVFLPQIRNCCLSSKVLDDNSNDEEYTWTIAAKGVQVNRK